MALGEQDGLWIQWVGCVAGQRGDGVDEPRGQSFYIDEGASARKSDRVIPEYIRG